MGKLRGGRPPKYKSEYANMAKEIIRHSGFSIPKLAKVFSVDRATVYRWMGEYPKFCDGIRQGRKIFDGIAIERSLVRRATGYRFTETTKEPNADGEMITTKRVSKIVPPDVAAIKHWQTNMDQANWKDRKSHEHGLDVDSQGIVERLNSALLRKVRTG
jgi:hypothetical protein